MCVHNKGIFRQVQMFYCCYHFAFLFLYFSGLSLHAAHAGLHIHGLFLALHFMLKITLIMLALADRAALNPAHLMA